MFANVNRSGNTLRLMNATELTAEQAELLKELLQMIIERRFEGSARKAALAIGISPSLISEVNSGRRQIGSSVANKVATYLGWPKNAVLQGPNRKAEDPLAIPIESRPVYRDRAEWTAVRDETARRYPRMPRTAINAAGETSALFIDGPLSVDMVYDAAQYWVKHATPDLLERLAYAAVDAQTDDEKAIEEQARALHRDAVARGEATKPVHQIVRELTKKQRKS